MKKFLSLIFGMVFLSLLPQKAWCQEAYAWLSEDGKTLTFCYDGDRATREGTTYDLNSLYNSPDWQGNEGIKNITKVKFDPSFVNVRPRDTGSWFASMTNLKDISGLQYLNTSNVYTMASMFYGCSNLKKIDLSHFDTSKVNSMIMMFEGCSSLKSLDLSNFDTSSLYTEYGVNPMYQMFLGCSNLEKLSISSTMSNFLDDACDGIGTPENPCSIIAPEGFDFGVDTSGDYFVWKSGYFTLNLSVKEAYAVLNGTTFTFYYDDLKATREGQIFSTDNVQTDLLGLCPQWMEIYDDGGWRNSLFNVTTVVFDPSFADAYPTSTSLWFEGCSNLEKIEGLEYLNTSEVTSMNEMFYACDKLKEIDLSHFDTSNVETVDKMFLGCMGLTNLDLSSFDCSNLNVAGSMLIRTCVSLKSLTIAEGMYFNDGDCMFVGTTESPCLINYPEGYDFGVDTSGDYFEWCSGYFKLGEAYTSVEKEAYAWYSEDSKTLTFCYDRVRAKKEGTTYNIKDTFTSLEIPKWMEIIDSNVRPTIQVNNVVIEPSFADARPTTINFWFMNMDIETIDGLQYLNTSEVTTMNYTFSKSRNLKNLDLSHFDTSNVIYMTCTFDGCSSLKNIDLSSFNTSKVLQFYNTFSSCESLEVLDVSNFDTSNATEYGASFEMFLNCTNLKTLSISSTMSDITYNACEGIGTAENPCLIIAPEGFDYGVDTSGNYFQWKSGYFTLGNTTPLVTLSNGDNEVPLSEYDGMTVDVELEEYTCQPEKWYSLCVPFDISAEQLKEAFGDDVDIQEMTGCAWNASEQILDMNFNKVTEVLAGRPYLLRVAGAVDAPQFDGVTINSDDPLTLNFGNCTMTGVLNATPLPLGDKSYLFIINNKFYYPATTNPLPAMRCYFHLLGDAAQANSIALNMEDDADGIVSVISDQAADSRIYYSVQGVSTTRPTHGIYINNGKKVVIK